MLLKVDVWLDDRKEEFLHGLPPPTSNSLRKGHQLLPHFQILTSTLIFIPSERRCGVCSVTMKFDFVRVCRVILVSLHSDLVLIEVVGVD